MDYDRYLPVPLKHPLLFHANPKKALNLLPWPLIEIRGNFWSGDFHVVLIDQ
jgi:hypothetical protein